MYMNPCCYELHTKHRIYKGVKQSATLPEHPVASNPLMARYQQLSSGKASILTSIWILHLHVFTQSPRMAMVHT